MSKEHEHLWSSWIPSKTLTHTNARTCLKPGCEEVEYDDPPGWAKKAESENGKIKYSDFALSGHADTLALNIWNTEMSMRRDPTLKDAIEVIMKKIVPEVENFVQQQTRKEIENDEGAIICKFCKELVPAKTAHLHQGSWVGDECCWDERLRSSE